MIAESAQPRNTSPDPFPRSGWGLGTRLGSTSLGSGSGSMGARAEVKVLGRIAYTMHIHVYNIYTHVQVGRVSLA